MSGALPISRETRSTSESLNGDCSVYIPKCTVAGTSSCARDGVTGFGALYAAAATDTWRFESERGVEHASRPRCTDPVPRRALTGPGCRPRARLPALLYVVICVQNVTTE